MVACLMSVSWFAREVMLFSPRACRCGTLQALSDGDGLTRKPISDCCAQRVSGLHRRVLRCRVAARWLPLHLADA